MKMLIALTAMGVVLSTSLQFLYARRDRYVMRTHKIAEGVYLFHGTGMNAMAVIADEEVILVDTMMNGWWGLALEAALRRVTDKPVTTIINTNSHPSHSGNNFRFAGDGVSVIAHEQTRSRLERRVNFQGAGARHLPQTTFRDRLTVMRGKERIELYYFGASNTDGDAWVVFPSRRLMHIGDVVKKDEMLEITSDSGGRAVAYADTMARGIATIKGVDLVVAGHARPGIERSTIPWSELANYQSTAGGLVETVRKAMAAAADAEGVVAIVLEGGKFKHFDRAQVSDAVRATYAELAAAGVSAREEADAEYSPAALTIDASPQAPPRP
jgi:glyoxylase-like metal-dependent hydrolase (beta-lactamase superfamily II)